MASRNLMVTKIQVKKDATVVAVLGTEQEGVLDLGHAMPERVRTNLTEDQVQANFLRRNQRQNGAGNGSGVNRGGRNNNRRTNSVSTFRSHWTNKC